MSRALAIATIALLCMALAVACGSGEAEPATAEGDVAAAGDDGSGPTDFCAASERFAEAELQALEQSDDAEGRRAAAEASVEAYENLAALAPETVRADAQTALEGQRGSFEALDRIGWSEDALSRVDGPESDELLTELNRYFGDEYLRAEERVITFVRAECDPAFLGG